MRFTAFWGPNNQSMHMGLAGSWEHNKAGNEEYAEMLFSHFESYATVSGQCKSSSQRWKKYY